MIAVGPTGGLNINGLTATSVVDLDADSMPIYRPSVPGNRKITLFDVFSAMSERIVTAGGEVVVAGGNVVVA